MFFLRTSRIPPVLDGVGKLGQILVFFIFLYVRGFSYPWDKRGIGMYTPSLPTTARNRDKNNCGSCLVLDEWAEGC